MALFANEWSIAAYLLQLLVDEFLAETEVRNLLASAETLEVKKGRGISRDLGEYLRQQPEPSRTSVQSRVKHVWDWLSDRTNVPQFFPKSYF